MSAARRRFFTLLTSATSLGLVALACAPGPSAGAAGAKKTHYVNGGTLTELIPSDPGNLDPLTTVTSETRTLDFLAYDSLVHLTAKAKVVSGLATSWKQSGTGYVFTIRKGVTCADGSPMSPATIAGNINFIADPANKSPLLTLFIPSDAKATADTATSKVTITLAKPFPFFLQNLSAIPLVCAKGLADQASLAGATDGSGPYVLSQAVAGSQYTFTVRKGYHWGPGGASTSVKGIPAKIVAKVVSDSTTQANLLLDGGANIAAVSGLASKPLRNAHLFHKSDTLVSGELWFNQGAGHVTTNLDVRKAIVQALDFPEMGKVLTQDLGTPATSLVAVTPAACAADTVKGAVPATNGKAAGALLTKAGWKLGKNGVRTKGGKPLKLALLYANTGTGDPGSAFELAATELKKIGIQVNLVGEAVTPLESVIFGSGNWDIVDITVNVSYPNELLPFLAGPAAPTGENFAHISNSGYTSLSTKASALPGTSGCSDWRKAEKDLYKAFDVFPFENQDTPVWGNGATFKLGSTGLVATSLRLVKG